MLQSDHNHPSVRYGEEVHSCCVAQLEPSIVRTSTGHPDFGRWLVHVRTTAHRISRTSIVTPCNRKSHNDYGMYNYQWIPRDPIAEIKTDGINEGWTWADRVRRIVGRVGLRH